MTHEKAVQQWRDEKLAQYSAGLERMAGLVDFAAVAAAADAAYPRPDQGKGGRPPYATLLMVRVPLLQALYNPQARIDFGNSILALDATAGLREVPSYSDEEVEHQLLDRRSFQRFCSVADELHVPDARTVWLFRQRLLAAGLGAQAVFEAVQQQLQARGHIPRGGQIVDATIVRAPVQHPDKGEKAQVNEGKPPEDWSPKNVHHRDIQARRTKKHGRSFFGYKLHARVDARWNLVPRWKVTPAKVDGGKTVRAVTLARNGLAIALKCAAYNLKRLVWLEARAAAV